MRTGKVPSTVRRRRVFVIVILVRALVIVVLVIAARLLVFGEHVHERGSWVVVVMVIAMVIWGF